MLTNFLRTPLSCSDENILLIRGSLGVGFLSGINLGELETQRIPVIVSLISVVRASGKAQKEVLCKNRPGNLLALDRTCGVAGILGLD